MDFGDGIMAVGNFGISHSADNTSLTVQPLGTVVLCCMGYTDDDTAERLRTTDGVKESQWVKTNQATMVSKIYANNTEYWTINSAGATKSTVICWVEVE